MEIIIPGSESVHGAKWAHQLEIDSKRQPDSYFVPMGNKLEQEAVLVESAIAELEIEGLRRWIDPFSGDYEFLAPEGFEFIMRGKFLVWDDSYDPPKPSEDLVAERGANGDYWDEDDETGTECVSEFRGPRISLELNHQNVNRHKPVVHSDWRRRNLYRSRDGDRPSLQVCVKASTEICVAEDSLMVLPFNLSGRPEPMKVTLPDREMRFNTVNADGDFSEVIIELVSIQDVQQGIKIPQTLSHAGSDELWIPGVMTRPTYEEFKQQEPRAVEYMKLRLGGDDQAVIDFYRRVYGTPFKDDPVWRSKDLEWGHLSVETLESGLARRITNMSDGELKELGKTLFALVNGNADAIHDAEEAKRMYAQQRISEEPF